MIYVYRTRRAYEKLKHCEDQRRQAPITPINLLSHDSHHHHIPYPRFHPWPHPPLLTSNLFSMPPCRRTIAKPRTSFSTTLLPLGYNPATHPTPSTVVDLPQDERQNKRSQRRDCLVMALNSISVERKKNICIFSRN
jgi:hypothetical protein